MKEKRNIYKLRGIPLTSSCSKKQWSASIGRSKHCSEVMASKKSSTLFKNKFLLVTKSSRPMHPKRTWISDSVVSSQYLRGRQSLDIYDPSSLRRTLRICSIVKGWSAHNSWVKARQCASTNTVCRYFLRCETECNLSGFNLQAGLARKGNQLEVILLYSCRALDLSTWVIR